MRAHPILLVLSVRGVRLGPRPVRVPDEPGVPRRPVLRPDAGRRRLLAGRGSADRVRRDRHLRVAVPARLAAAGQATLEDDGEVLSAEVSLGLGGAAVPLAPMGGRRLGR